MRRTVKVLWAAAAMVLVGAPALAGLVQKKPPFFASISAGKARMRSGPGKTYPAIWLYQRADLPMKVIDTYDHGQWYKVEDPGGTQGWMQSTLISDTRTGFVIGQPIEMRDAPRDGARILWRAAPGVVGRLSKCAGGWCWFDVRGQGGFVEANRLWGVDPGETIG